MSEGIQLMHMSDAEVDKKLQISYTELDVCKIVVEDFSGNSEKLARLLEEEIRLNFRHCNLSTVQVSLEGHDHVFSIACDYAPNISAFGALQLIVHCTERDELPCYTHVRYKDRVLYFS